MLLTKAALSFVGEGEMRGQTLKVKLFDKGFPIG
jgi:hypothetical protein